MHEVFADVAKAVAISALANKNENMIFIRLSYYVYKLYGKEITRLNA